MPVIGTPKRLRQMLELEIFAFAIWTFFLVYATWYFTSAKCSTPITTEEAKILWKIHRRDSGCRSKKWREMTRHGKIVGFECSCGYKHVQRRPIIVNLPSVQIDQQACVPDEIRSQQSASLTLDSETYVAPTHAD